MDPIGIIDETYFWQIGQRSCDDTAPNMEGEPLITLEAHDALHPEEEDE